MEIEVIGQVPLVGVYIPWTVWRLIIANPTRPASPPGTQPPPSQPQPTPPTPKPSIDPCEVLAGGAIAGSMTVGRVPTVYTLVGGVLLGLAGAELAKRCDDEERDRVHEECLRLYVLCTESEMEFRAGGKCGVCFDQCRREGEWPFHRCSFK